MKLSSRQPGKLLRGTFLIFLLFNSFPNYAQEKLISFDRIGHLDSGSIIGATFSLTQDSQGFIWLGTIPTGVVRFDGYEFKHFRHDPGNPNSLVDNEVREVYADDFFTLWIGTALGLDRLDVQSEQFTHYSHDPADPTSISYGGVNEILIDANGNYWIGTDSGLNQLDPATGHFTKIDLLGQGSGDDAELGVWSMSTDTDGTLWIGTQGQGLFHFNPYTRSSMHYTVGSVDANNLPSDTVNSILRDSRGVLWIASDGGLSQFDAGTGQFLNYNSFPDDDPRRVLGRRASTILEDSKGNFWVGLWHDGMAHFDRDTGVVQHIVNDPGNSRSLAAGAVWQMIEDRSGTLIVDNGVLNFLRPTKHAYALYPHPADNPAGPGVEAQVTLDDSNGVIWTGSMTALRSFNPASGEWGEVEVRNNFQGVPAIHESRSGQFWFSAHNSVNLLDRSDGHFASYQMPTSPEGIYEDSTGMVWLALPQHGLGMLDSETGHLKIYSSIKDDPTSLSDSFTLFVDEDSEGRLWVGTINGLNRYDRQNDRFYRYGHDPDDDKSLTHREVRSFLEDSSGRIWFGTADGLNRYIPESDTFERLKKSNSPSVEWVSDIVQGPNGRLYLNSIHEISEFDPESGLFRTRRIWDQGLTRLSASYAIDSDGLIWSGSDRGLVSIDSQVLFAEPQPPKVVLTDFHSSNDPAATDIRDESAPPRSSVNTASALRLNWDDSLLSFKFAALEAPDPREVRYSYKLDGLDADWVASDATSRSVTYSQVPPGDYVFRVRTAYSDGIWQDGGVALNVSIAPPIWKTWWAYTIYAFIFFSSFRAFVRYRTLSLTQRANLLESKVDERTRQVKENEQLIRRQADHLEELLKIKEKFFANISHEFRTPLTLILGPIERMLKNTKEAEIASQLRMVRENGERLLRLVDQLLGLSQLSSEQSVTPSPQPLLPLVRTIVNSFQTLAHEKQIHLKLVDSRSLRVNCSPDALEKILLNLISNAIKYTPIGGWVDVHVEIFGEDKAKLSVSDSGIGIASEHHDSVFERFYRVGDAGESVPGSGLGLALVKELAQSYGGSVELESSLGGGTTIAVLLPLNDVGNDEPESSTQGFETETMPLEFASEAPEVNDASTQDNGNSNGFGDGNGQASLLVVEDNRQMQEYLVSLLSEHYHCRVAADGEQAIEMAIELIPDLVLCDVMLPKMNGFKVSETIKGNELTSHIPIIMLTGRGDQNSRLKGLKEHVDDYLTKPFSNEELSLRIANLLSARDAMKRKFSRQLFDGSEVSSSMQASELAFLNKLQSAMERHYSDPDFRVERLSVEMAMSERQLQRKLKALIDHSPAEFLRNFRLNLALIQLKKGTRVGMVAEAVGFASQSYFASCFKAEFGMTPYEYQQSKN